MFENDETITLDRKENQYVINITLKDKGGVCGILRIPHDDLLSVTFDGKFLYIRLKKEKENKIEMGRTQARSVFSFIYDAHRKIKSKQPELVVYDDLLIDEESSDWDEEDEEDEEDEP